MLVSHGVRGRADDSDAHARAVMASRLYDSVRVCSLTGDPAPEAVLPALDGQKVDVMPLLICDGHTMAALRSRLAPFRGVRVHPPVGESPAFAGFVLDQAHMTCRAAGWKPSKVALVLAAHGSTHHTANGRLARRVAEVCKAGDRFGEVRCGFLDEAPRLDAVLSDLRARPVVVLGLFMQEGTHGRDDVLAALRRANGQAIYAGAIGASPTLLPIILGASRTPWAEARAC